MKKHFKLALTALSGAGLLSLGIPKATAADGTFIAGTSWGTGSNWSAGSIPNAIGAVATFDSGTGPLSTSNLSVSMGASNKTVGTLNIVNNSSNSLTFNASSTITGTSTLSQFIYQSSTGTAALNLAGSSTNITTFTTPTVLNSTLLVTVSNTAANITAGGAGIFSTAALSGTGGIIKTGDGTLNISGTQSFTGGVTLLQGTLVTNLGGTVVSGTNIVGPFGTGALTLVSGTLRSFSNTARTYYNALNISGNVSFGSTTQAGAQTFSANAGNVTTLTTSATLTTTSDLTLAQNIIGTGSSRLGKAGTATLVLSGSNSGIAGFNVTGGVLEFGGVSTMGTPASATPDYFTINSGTIRFNTTISTTPLSSNRGFMLGAAGGTIEVVGSATTIVKSNGIFQESAGGATLTKSGVGIYMMTGGTSTYTGATVVSQGTLLLDTGAAIATSNVTVASGATVGGAGYLGGTVTVNGTLAPGFSGTAGTLTVANSLSLGSSAAVTMKLGGNTVGTYDQVTGITNLTLDGTITVSLLGAYDPTAGSSFQLLSWSGALDATNFNLLTDLILPSLDPGLSWDTSNFLTNGTITAVPEPATNALLVCSVGLVVGMRRFFGARKRS